MKVLFLGFQTWGQLTLDAIIKSRHIVPLVITHPQSDHIYETIWNDSVKELACSNGIPVIEKVYANDDETIKLMRNVAPDIIVSSNWRTWLSPEACSIPKFGSINIHDALLPKYGGFSPINWSIINGEIETGVTVHYMTEEFDLGDIIIQEKVPIYFSDTSTDVFKKTLPLFPKLALQALGLIESNKVKRIVQEKSQATFYHKRSERDSLINWNDTNLHIYNLIRAQSDPYPNAYTFYNYKKLKIKKASLPAMSCCGTPGRIFSRVNLGVVVVCGAEKPNSNQGLVLEIVQEEGSEPVAAAAYFKRMGEYLE
ncbi:MAG: methionyl-tRNA formyltransferase [Thermoplasmata archaeon]|nr:methionyl-tRNA formyltransferase [Thermoplasmata archaeon]